ncbi:hypothetical protein [Meridianimarinicoccus aquatilis]|uniref:Uncharacterized protein n=1 Tax=Meridianimarinicoccus aquatilis TaxID=2552766 RepID=A0A4R6AN18_9RHOB|nr:hypothetical protein [Fluviibacterium aquatile]TDL84714.1 hypothetical protein E2L05_17300 [Fluviibacterium aquatile]
MHKFVLSLAAAVLLSGCYSWGDGSDWSDTGSGWQAAGTELADAPLPVKVDHWEQEWATAKQEVADARAEVVAEGRTLPPKIDDDVTELVNREITGPSDAERLQRLQDSVSDARRLAELVSAG